MKKEKVLQSEEELLNTNETMNDYSFFYQMICENKKMDFESDQKVKDDECSTVFVTV